MHYLGFFPIAACALSALAADVAAPKCSSLHDFSCLSAYNASIVHSRHYDAGAKNVSGVWNDIAFCQVNTRVDYDDNDTLYFDLRLPSKHESSRFIAVGNGGQAGLIDYNSLMSKLNKGLGLAVAGSDRGHRLEDNDFGARGNLGAPGAYQAYLHDEDQIKAWLHNAIALFTPAARALVEEVYGQQPAYPQYRGCSAGGGQGFALAQFYPHWFDGIIAGGPCNGFSFQILAFLWNQQRFAQWNSPETLDFVQVSVLDACDALDGVEDRLIENPRACKSDSSSPACPEDATRSNETTYFTPAQISVIKAIYRGPVRSGSPETLVYIGLPPGTTGWLLPSVSGALSTAFAIPLLQQIVLDNLSYDHTTFDWASDVDTAIEVLLPLFDAISTDLSSFRATGIKMLVYAGWADPNFSAKYSLQHVRAITRDTIGKNRIVDNDFMKLVTIPGVGHCRANIAKYQYVQA